GVEVAVEQPGEEGALLVRGLTFLLLAGGGVVTLGRRLDRRGDEQRRVQAAIRAGKTEQADIHVGLTLHARERDDHEIVDLEALREGVEPFAGEHVLALAALLIDPHADRVAQTDLEATGAIEGVDDLVDGRIGLRVLDARLHEGHQAQLDLSSGDPRSVARLHLAAGARRPGRVGLEHLLDDEPADLLLRPAEDLAGLRMLELAALPVESQLDSGDDAVLAAKREGHGAVLDLDHLTVDLRKEGLNLINEHTDGGRRSLGSRRPGAPESGKDTEGDDPSCGSAHAGTDASISPRLAQGVGRVKEW